MNPIYVFIFFLTSRCILDSFPQYTHIDMFAGMSIMKIHSGLLIIYGLSYILYDRKLQLDRKINIIFFLVLFSYIITAIYTGTFAKLVLLGLMWLYLFTIMIITKACLNINGTTKVMKAVVLASLYPLANHAYTVATGKMFYNGHICRYIGTYAHQSDSCFLVFIAVPAAFYLLITRKILYERFFYLLVILYSHVALYLISYRTSWMGMATYWVILCFFVVPRQSFVKQLCIFVSAGIIISCIIFMVGGRIRDRMDPLVDVLSTPSKYFEFSDPERKEFPLAAPHRNGKLSSRLDIWNVSLQAYFAAPLDIKILGFGLGKVDSIVKKYLYADAYAHNEFVSSLVETGLQGFMTFLLWITVLAYVLLKRVEKHQLCTILSVPVFFQMIVTAMGTMVFRDMGAVSYLGIYMGLGLYCRENGDADECL